jgi:hypothetical protein
MTLEQKAQKVRATIESKDIDFKEVAKDANVHEMTLQRYFTLGTMSLNKLQRICDVVGLEIIIREKVEL